MDAQTYGTTTGIADSEIGADTQAAEGHRDSGDLERRVASLEALFAAAGEHGSGQFAGAAQDAHDGSAGAGTEAGPTAEEIARAAEEAERAAALYRATVNEHEFAVATAAHGIEIVIAKTCELYGLLIWAPDRIGEAGRLLTLAENGLAGLRATLATVESHAKAVASLGPSPADPINDLASRYDDALTRMRAARRRLDGLITLAESDIFNGAALDATARALQEEIALSTFANMGLTLAINRSGLVR